MGGAMFALFNYSNKFAMTVFIIIIIAVILDFLIIRNLLLGLATLVIWAWARHKGYFISEFSLP